MSSDVDPSNSYLYKVNRLLGLFGMTYGVIACLVFSLFIMLFTNYYVFGLIYLFFIYSDRKTVHTGGRRFEIFRSKTFWKPAIDYLPIRLVKTCELPSNKNYLFCAFPHGLVSMGAIGNFMTESNEVSKVFSGLVLHMAAIDSFLMIPIFREFFIGLGGVASSKESLLHLLGSPKKGNVVVLLVGGAQEAEIAEPYNYKIVLKNRKGFVETAIKAGCPLVPVFSFGENELFEQLTYTPGTLVHSMQSWLKKHTRLSFCLPKATSETYYFPLPKWGPVTTVVGEPIDVPHNDNPKPELVDKYHEIFVQRLTNLFETHKYQYLAKPDITKLIIT